MSVDSIKGLVHLAELLLAPADVRKVISELGKAVSDSREVAEQTKAAQRDLANLRNDMESERAMNAALELKAKAEADAAAAKWIKDDLMRRVNPLSSVVGS